MVTTGDPAWLFRSFQKPQKPWHIYGYLANYKSYKTSPWIFPRKLHHGTNMGLSENVGYTPQWNSHLISFKNGIMISKTIGFRGLAYFQSHPYDVPLKTIQLLGFTSWKVLGGVTHPEAQGSVLWVTWLWYIIYLIVTMVLWLINQLHYNY